MNPPINASWHGLLIALAARSDAQKSHRKPKISVTTMCEAFRFALQRPERCSGWPVPSGAGFPFVEASTEMDNENSQLWRGVVTDTCSGRFVTEKIVRVADHEDAHEQLRRWFHGMDLAHGADVTLASHRLVSRGPESLLGSRPRSLWPVDPPAARQDIRSRPPSERYL